MYYAHLMPDLCAGDDGDCMYIILRGSCNVHVDPDFDETAQAGALQKASLQPKAPKKKQPLPGGLAAKHLLRGGAGHSLERLSSTASTRSDASSTQGAAGPSRRSLDDGHSRRSTGQGTPGCCSAFAALPACRQLLCQVHVNFAYPGSLIHRRSLQSWPNLMPFLSALVALQQDTPNCLAALSGCLKNCASANVQMKAQDMHLVKSSLASLSRVSCTAHSL